MTQQELIAQRIPGISNDEITAHFSLLPDRYFIHTEGAEIALHIQMVNKLFTSIATAEQTTAVVNRLAEAERQFYLKTGRLTP